MSDHSVVITLLVDGCSNIHFSSLLKQSVHSSCAIMVLYIVHTWKLVSSGFMLMAEFLLAVWLSIGFAKVKYIFNLPISDIIILSLNNMYFLVI